MKKGIYWQMSVVFGLSLLISSCTSSSKETTAEYRAEIENWQQLRVDSLKGVTGFLNLAGLFWLENEVNTFGSDSTHTVVFPPQAPADLGQIIMRGDSLWFVQSDEDLVKIQGGDDTDTTLVFVKGSVKRVMSAGDLHWFIIKRGTEHGIRLKDFNHPLLTTFNHIETYPIDANWQVKATWEEYQEPKIVTVHNQVGMDLDMPVPGALHFELHGEAYLLEPVGSAEHETLFVMIYDETSGHETYGSGRYIDVPKPNAEGVTYIDFNKAYNPPCAFTEFATCLFPHKTNRLPIKIEAGEKYSGAH